METNNNLPIPTREELISTFSQVISEQQPSNDISLYSKVVINNKQEETEYYNAIREEVRSLVIAFSTIDKDGRTVPAHPMEFYTELCKTICSERIPINQLHCSIEQLKKSHRYMKFTMSSVLGYDIKIKTYSKDYIYKRCGQFPSPAYPLVRFPNGTEAWISKEDYNANKCLSEKEELIRQGKEPLIRSVLLLRDYHEYAQ